MWRVMRVIMRMIVSRLMRAVIVTIPLKTKLASFNGFAKGFKLDLTARVGLTHAVDKVIVERQADAKKGVGSRHQAQIAGIVCVVVRPSSDTKAFYRCFIAPN